MLKLILTVFFSITHLWLFAQPLQFGFELKADIPVFKQGVQLPNAWAGGLNAVQYLTLDLDGDAQDDLVVFDRTTFKLKTFLARNQQYVFAPEYEKVFPQVAYWLVLKDMNCDGKKDLLTGDPNGTYLYRNIGDTTPVFDTSNPYKLYTTNLTGKETSLLIDVTDIPAIIDVDKDGYLDLLMFTPKLGNTIQFHKNISFEKYGDCDMPVFRNEDREWGRFYELESCQGEIMDNGRVAGIEHAGSSLFAEDLSGDGLIDVIVGESGCTKLMYAENKGTQETAFFPDITNSYPVEEPVDLQVFPAVYYEDVNFDGAKDLLVSPNVRVNEAGMIDFTQSSWLYINNGTDNLPVLSLSEKDFLQKSMIDIGEYAMPVVADYNGDGVLDLFIGNYAIPDESGVPVGRISYWKNIGSNIVPSFEWQTDDFLNISSLALVEVQPQFVDINSDGILDFVFSGRSYSNNQNQITYLLNSASEQKQMLFDLDERRSLPLVLRPQDTFYFYDVNKDEQLDLLVGDFNGSLSYYQNKGGFLFEKQPESFLGIEDFKYRYPAPLIADFDGDGKEDLLLGGSSGNIRLYQDILSEKEEIAFREDLIYDKTLQQFYFYGFGKNIYPALLGDYIVLGTVEGGVFLLKAGMFAVAGTQEDSVVIFPNPAQNRVNISLQKAQALEVEVFTAQGVKKGKYQFAEPAQKHSIDVGEWIRGVYVLAFVYDGKAVRRKVVVH